MDVAVFGAGGRMGQASCQAVAGAEDLNLIAEIGSQDDKSAAAEADVVIDFTRPEVVLDNVQWCIERGINVVIGTSGFTEEKVSQLRELLGDSPEVGVVIAPNFSIGAVLMMRFAEQAAEFYESVEIIELHHPNKADAPSGTALATAQRIAAARQSAGLPAASPDATVQELPGARGARVNDIAVHGVRLRGLVAHQEVLFGEAGETLTLRHDSFDRVSFMPGVLAAVRAVGTRPGITWGIESILGL